MTADRTLAVGPFEEPTHQLNFFHFDQNFMSKKSTYRLRHLEILENIGCFLRHLAYSQKKSKKRHIFALFFGFP